MKKQYIINKTLTNLLFKNGYLTIPRGGFAAVASEDLGAAEFVNAEVRGWIDIADKAPESVEVPAVETVVIQNPNQGMTADELAAELAKNEPVAEKVVVEALGAGAPAGAEGEATVEALGRDSTVEVTPGAEEGAESAEGAKAAPKAPRKKAAQ